MAGRVYGPDGYPADGPPPPDYPSLAQAAAEAREASRRYWRGKPSYPVRWPPVARQTADDPQRRLAESLRRHHRR